MEIWKWGTLNETPRELEPQRLQLHQANQWDDYSQRDRMFGEFEMRNKLFQESRTHDC